MSERSDKFRKDIALLRAAIDLLDCVLKRIEGFLSPQSRKERIRDWPLVARQNLVYEMAKKGLSDPFTGCGRTQRTGKHVRSLAKGPRP
jgi:hypothetical protein